MGDRRAERFKTLLAEINVVLYTEWAPIGFVGELPLDEYESYAAHIILLLASGAGETDLATYLSKTGLAITGNSFGPASVRDVAERLMTFKDAANVIAP